MKYRIFTEGFLKTNSVVIIDGDVCVVIDIPFGARDLCGFVLQNRLKVAAVLLTHGHFDHCGGVAGFFETCRCSAPVFAHEADFGLCRNASENIWSLPAADCFPSQSVKEGNLSIGGMNFSVWETPGHTEGSVVYAVENILLSGDTLLKNSVGRTDFCESVPSKMYSSLQKLRNVKQNYTVICGHGENTSLDYEKKNNPYLK